jgi:cytochrome c oxidase subunit 2
VPDRWPKGPSGALDSQKRSYESMAVAVRVIAALTWLTFPSLALAQERPEGPVDWQMDFQNPATVVMDYIHWFSWYTLIIVALITALVVVLLGWCALKFNERANPVPSRVTHNTLVEVLWTVLPVLILVAIAIPSFKLLYGEYDPSKLYPDFNPQTTKFLTLKFTGSQWAWDASYANDEDNAGFGVTEPIDVYMLPIADDQLAEGQLRNLSVDNPVVVPVSTFVRVQVTAEGDAIHSFAMPAFGLKEDAVPGRLNETYFKAEREGVFYGQCSELCGKDHAFMPIEIRVVSADKFRAWAAQAASDLPGAYQTLAKATGGNNEERLAAR